MTRIQKTGDMGKRQSHDSDWDVIECIGSCLG